MAKENFAILHGQVINTPKVYISRNTGQPKMCIRDRVFYSIRNKGHFYHV